jgi:hypothetical protein
VALPPGCLIFPMGVTTQFSNHAFTIASTLDAENGRPLAFLKPISENAA